MMISNYNIRSTALYNKMISTPLEHIRSRVKQRCEALPQRKRITIVTILVSVFLLAAFFVFGHACYRLGAGQARRQIEVEHMRSLDITNTTRNEVIR